MSEHYAALVAKVLQQQPEEVRSSGLSREQGIDAVRRALATRRIASRRQGWVRSMAPLAVAAGVLVAAGWALVGRLSNSHSDFTAQVVGGAAQGVGVVAGAADGTVGHISDHSFAPGQSVASGKGRPTVVAFENGTQIALSEQSELEYRQGAALRRFGLLRGAVHLQVAKLSAGERFIVETPDAEVEVRGTAFTVELLSPEKSCANALTRVAVEEGVVEVRFAGETHRVAAHEIRPATCATKGTEHQEAVSRDGATQDRATTAAVGDRENDRNDAATGVQPEPAERQEIASSAAPYRGTVVQGTGRASRVASASLSRNTTRGSSSVDDASATEPPVSKPTVSTPTRRSTRRPNGTPKLEDVVAVSSNLALQNQLYSEAVTARKAGRSSEALDSFERLMTHFPGGPLTESAAVERIRMLRRLNLGQARAEAQTYLDQYRNGFARREMIALAADR